MARRYVADLKPGERIESETFLVVQKDLRTTTQGSLYIHAVLADRSGQVVTRVWSASEDMYQAIPEGGFINVKGRTENYKGSLQFVIEAIRPVERSQVELSEFLPRTERDIDAMWAQLQEALKDIKNPFVAAMVAEFVQDEPLVELFKNAPAAMNMHHAYLGGLLEHTLAVMEIARLVIPRYPKVSLDLVLAGLFLHDLGKTVELGFDTNFHYTEQGQLLGHICICSSWIEQKAAAVEKRMGKPFPKRIKWALQHIVLSHHAKPEFGSPRIPAMPEALAVHYIDNLDAKLEMSTRAISEDRDASGEWTSFHRGLDTKLYKPNVLKDAG